MTSVQFGPTFSEMLPGMLILFVQLGLAGVCLLRLHHRMMGDLAKVLWALAIVLIPWAGPLAFLLVSPGRSAKSSA